MLSAEERSDLKLRLVLSDFYSEQRNIIQWAPLATPIFDATCEIFYAFFKRRLMTRGQVIDRSFSRELVELVVHRFGYPV